MILTNMESGVLSFWDKFKLNLSLWYKKATYYVLGMWGLAAVYWNTMMTDADHQALYDMVPWGLGKLAPAVLFGLTYVAANGWPQPKLNAQLADKKEEAVAAKLDGPTA